MLRRTRRCLDRDRTQRRRAPFGKHYAIYPGAVGGPQQRAQVLRVFHAVEGQKQPRPRPPRGKREQILQIQNRLGANHCHHALVSGTLGQLGKLVARLEAQAHPRVAAQVDDSLQALVMPLPRHADVVEFATPRTQSFFYRVQAIKNLHPLQFTCPAILNPPGAARSGTGRLFTLIVVFLMRLSPWILRLINKPMATAQINSDRLALAAASRAESVSIAQRLKRQDPAVLDSLIVEYQHRLLRYLLYLTSNRELAEDLFQETWMRVLLRGAQFKGDSRFDTWLFTIARNLVIDYRRRRTMASLEELAERGDDERPFEIASDAPTPFDHYMTRQNGQIVAEALLTLDPLHREVLVLRFHEEMALEEIATVTCAPLSTVKSRLYRGMAALRPRIAERTQEAR